MSRLAGLVEEREKGAIPASIGSSLAIESLGGFGEFPNENPRIHQHDELWVNVRTLFRNCFNAVEREAHPDLTVDDIIYALTTDMRVIQATIEKISSGKMKVSFFICSLRSLKKQFPNAKHKDELTNKQSFERDLERDTIRMLLSEEFRPTDLTLNLFDVKFMVRGKDTVLLTHYPLDLLWRDRFTYLTLLESHTGRLKNQSEWHTKITGGRKYDRIPFNRMTMQVFGDGNLLFSSMGLRTKNLLLELAEKKKWTSLTTNERIRFSIKESNIHPKDQQFFLNLLTH